MINNDVSMMMDDLKKYDVKTIFDKIHVYLEKQKSQILDSEGAYNEYKLFGDIIKRNLKMINKKKEGLRGLDNYLQGNLI